MNAHKRAAGVSALYIPESLLCLDKAFDSLYHLHAPACTVEIVFEKNDYLYQ
jgi:hypothetical protein